VCVQWRFAMLVHQMNVCTGRVDQVLDNFPMALPACSGVSPCLSTKLMSMNVSTAQFQVLYNVQRAFPASIMSSILHSLHHEHDNAQHNDTLLDWFVFHGMT
jgi:hypothetical protein